MKNKLQPIFSLPGFLSLALYEHLVCMLLFTLLIIKKIPFILYNKEINPDESQMLTQAITLEFDPVFWRSVDGTTSGPINSYFILLLKYLGFPFNYTTLHFAAVIMVIFSLFMTYLTLRLFFSFKASFLSILIASSFFFFTNHNDFNHYNSELPSVALITIAVFLLAQIYRSENSSDWLYFTLGAVCCLVPLAKLQGGPLGFIYIVFAGLIILSDKISYPRKSLKILLLIFGSVSIISSLLFFLYFNNILYSFYIMYIKTNLNHYNPGSQFNLFIKLIFKSSYDYLFFLIYCSIIWILSIIISIKNKSYDYFKNKLLWFSQINIITSLFVIGRTGYIFEHYLFYSIFPITLLTAYALSQILDSGKIKMYTQEFFYLIIGGLFVGLLVIYNLKLSRKNQNFKLNETTPYEAKVINIIKQYTNPTDCIVVWGWNLTYHTVTGLRQGTRENHSIRCMTTNSLGAIHDPQLVTYYGRQYVDDMKRNRPAIFIDEVRANSFFQDSNLVVHQNLKELSEYITKNYILVSKESGVLVYVRKNNFQAHRTNRNPIQLH